jgi:hypothetical protein
MYILGMSSNFAKIILALFCLFAIIFACSKKPTEPEVFSSGTITFINSSYYTITLTTMIQSRHGNTATNNFNRQMPPYLRLDINNLLDGGLIFPGGDIVSINFESVARQPDNPDLPLFARTVALTVNGPQNIRIKGQSGEYDIGGY